MDVVCRSGVGEGEVCYFVVVRRVGFVVFFLGWMVGVDGVVECFSLVVNCFWYFLGV